MGDEHVDRAPHDVPRRPTVGPSRSSNVARQIRVDSRSVVVKGVRRWKRGGMTWMTPSPERSEPMETPKEIRMKIVGKATGDADFRARLLSDPKGVIGQELGVTIPASLSVEVHEESGTTAHLVLSPRQQAERKRSAGGRRRRHLRRKRCAYRYGLDYHGRLVIPPGRSAARQARIMALNPFSAVETTKPSSRCGTSAPDACRASGTVLAELRWLMPLPLILICPERHTANQD